MQVYIVLDSGKQLSFDSIKDLKVHCFALSHQYYAGVVETIKNAYNEDIKVLKLNNARVI